jgi:VCBS repeat-containing protein
VAVATETLTVRSSLSAAATQTITVSIFGADDRVTSLTNGYTAEGPSVTESSPADGKSGGLLAAFDPDGLFVQNAGSVIAGAFTAPSALPFIVVGGDSPFTVPGPGQQSFKGQYGDFLLDTLSGLWTYTVAASLNPDGGAVDYLDIEALAGGQTATDVMLVRSNDQGASAAVAVTIIGRDDPATMVHMLLDGAAVTQQPLNPVAEVIEAGGAANANDPDPVAGGRVLSIDIDAGESGWAATAAPGLAGQYGNFSFDFETGDWSYRLRNADVQVQQLTAASVVTDTLALSSRDGTPHTITVQVRGANDTAAITVNPGVPVDGAVKEAGGSADGLVFDPVASGDLDVSDVDGASALTEARFRAVPLFNTEQGLNDLTGRYGMFTFNANTGGWTYQLDNKSAATQALHEGQIVTDAMLVYSKDVSASHIITVAIEGSYDQVDLYNAYGPDEATTGAQVRAEGTWRNASGVTTAVVADYNAAGQLSGSPAGAYLVPPAALLMGVYGSFTVTADGAWSYRLDNEDPDTLALVSAIDGAGNLVRSAQDFLTVSSTTGPDHPVPETYTIAIDVFGAYTVVDYKGLAGDTVWPNVGGAAAPGALPAIVGNGTITFTVRNGDGGETLRLYAGDPTPTPLPWGTVAVNDGTQTTVAMPASAASSWPGVINQILHVWDGDLGLPANPALNLGVSIAQGTADSDNVTMIGNGGLAAGYAGNDRISGTGWADYMDGGEHDDLLQGGGGNDTLLGGNGEDDLQGQADDDRLEGGFGKDTLDGGAGDDVLVPGAGRDRLTGGSGSDTFVFADGPFGSPNEDDVVTDYSVVDDTLWFDQSLLLDTGYGVAAIAGGGWFNTASAAQISMQTYEANDRFIYDAAQGLLYYDADGGTASGPLQPALVALFTGSPALVFGEFVFGPAPGP